MFCQSTLVGPFKLLILVLRWFTEQLLLFLTSVVCFVVYSAWGVDQEKGKEREPKR